ncbi:MAG: hypothetical protein E7672_09140 [Ruminococcaceae bacterium]|nr:hypothetical protein [Oscillospiraceae bacterium]
MQKSRTAYAKNILLPCLILSCIAGIFIGIVIFLFKLVSAWVISVSADIYSFVRAEPKFLPLLMIGAAIIGLISAIVLKLIPDCRGGGIPTSIAILRGLIPLNWVKNVVFVFFSALLTYFCAIPLGNEGPSVQIGTAIGRGTVRIFAKKNLAWDRYIMTGGACAGFAAATGAPLTGIFFAFEEAHRRFSPMIFIAASMTAIASSVTMQILCSISGGAVSYSSFSFRVDTVLPVKYLWAVLIVGVISGLSAAGFIKLYKLIRQFIKTKISNISFILRTVIIFVSVSLIGFFSAECISSGHHLVEDLIHGHGLWYLLIIYFCIRAVLLIVSNNSDITGGLFVPTLAFGAIIGALCGKAFVSLGILPEEYYVIMVIVGIASFLSSCSHTPIMAVTFAIEALSGLSNIIPISIGVTIAYLTVETLRMIPFTDTVIEAKVEKAHEGKTAHIVDTTLSVSDGAFVVGKEIRDILWPPTCIVLSVQKKNASHPEPTIAAGDVLTVHYMTHDPADTMDILEAIVGKQEKITSDIHENPSDNHIPQF